MEIFDLVLKSVDLLLKIFALIIGGGWAYYKVKEFREFKNWIQLDIDSCIIKLSNPVKGQSINRDESGNVEVVPEKQFTHAIDVYLNFTNRGKTRAKLYNIQVGVSSMRPQGKLKFNKKDGHLSLARLLTSGNIVPEFPVKGVPINKSSYYYIEPGVKQTISYLCLISEPEELIRIFSQFNLEEERLFPAVLRKKNGLYPHSVAKTFEINQNDIHII